MKLDQIRQKSDAELEALISETRQALATAVIDSRTKQMPNVKQFAAHKRSLARILTIQRQREITKLEETS